MTNEEITKKTRLLGQLARRELLLIHSETGLPTRFDWYDSSVFAQVGSGLYQIAYTTSMTMIYDELKKAGATISTEVLE